MTVRSTIAPEISKRCTRSTPTTSFRVRKRNEMPGFSYAHVLADAIPAEIAANTPRKWAAPKAFSCYKEI